ncbi:MAG: flagellar protein FlaG [Caulobacter sp.]|jgi:flagellar protein FlaG
MSSTVNPLYNAPEPVAAMIARPVTPAVEIQQTPPQGQSADLRLVIEEDEATGSFVYKTLDRRTGEVVKQLPREDVLKLKSAEDYAPGQVVDTRE